MNPMGLLGAQLICGAALAGVPVAQASIGDRARGQCSWTGWTICVPLHRSREPAFRFPHRQKRGKQSGAGCARSPMRSMNCARR